MQTALRCAGLIKRYGKVVAVDGLDLEVKPCETLALVGESGCGKTVTALSVLRLLKALFTFEGGLDYIAWKLERHSGQRIEVPMMDAYAAFALPESMMSRSTSS